jgi:peptidyl carrier protein
MLRPPLPLTMVSGQFKKERQMVHDNARVPSLAAVEKRVEKIWQDVLNMPEGRTDLTFFDLQGQSISAVRIVARIEDELGIAVDVGILFDDPDLTAFTRAVAASIDPADTASRAS